MELLGRRSPAPAEDIARRILGEDVTQIDTYVKRVKRMVGRVLTVNGLTSCANDHGRLMGGDKQSDAEPPALLTPLAEWARSPAARFPEPAWPASDHGSLASAARSPRSDQRTGKGADRYLP